MKESWKAGAVLCCTLFILSLALTAVTMGYAVSKEPDPEVTAVTTPQTVSKSSPFEGYFTFTQYLKSDTPGSYTVDDVKDITISVSSVNSAITLNRSHYTMDKGDILWLDADMFDNDSAIVPNYDYFKYSLRIPEKDMRRKGTSFGALKFNITYYNDNGDKLDSFTVQRTVFAELESSSSEKEEETRALSVVSYSIDPAKELKEGDAFTLRLTVQNNGSTACKNVAINLTLDGNIYVKGATNTHNLDMLEAGASVEVSFPLACIAKLETKSYPITINLSAPDVAASANPPIIYIPVTGTVKPTESETTLTTSKPQIIIESYDYGGLSVTGGKTFTLTMNFKNTSPKIAIENLKMTVAATPDGDKGIVAFTPANSSNTFFVSKVAPGSLFQKKIALYPKIDADPKSYGVTISYTYEAVIDGARQDKLEGTETISIPLFQPDRFEVNEADLYGPIYFGDQGQLNINYVNKGKSKIFNLAVKLEGNFTSTDGDTYIGNVESGTGDSFMATLLPQEEGTLKGTATFSYEDANGEVKEVQKEFSCEVLPMPTMEPGIGGDIPTDVPPEEQGLPMWGIALIAAGGVVVLIIVLVIVRKRVKARKLRKLEEEDDYEELPPVFPPAGNSSGEDKE